MDEYDLNIKPCVGCGLCCIKAPCVAAGRLYPGAKLCPQLFWNGERHICGLMELPGDVGRSYRQELYAGEGCCMGLFNTWRQEVKNRLPEVAVAIASLDPMLQIFLRCLGRELISSDVIFLVVSSFAQELQNSGMSKEAALKMGNLALLSFQNNRSSMTAEFMG